MRRADHVEIAILTVAWAGAIALVDPRGNFPLHDDWDFAIATWRFAESGHFHFTQFTAVALRAQVLWGALWTKLFGQSFNVLRASTLVLSLGAVLLVDRILARAGAARGVRMLAALALLFHPIFLWASCTYMTDVPFVFASAAALYCFVRAWKSDRLAWLVAGCCAVAVAWFIRQNGAYLLGAGIGVSYPSLPPSWRSSGRFCSSNPNG
jgi:4-amino-4-deoxy-L-arabinose transferase-like glycosyltransferase